MLVNRLKRITRVLAAAFASVVMLAATAAVLTFGLLLSVSLIITTLVASRFVMRRNGPETSVDDGVIDLDKGDYHSVVR